MPRGLPALFGIVIVDLIGFGIALPILPFYAREFGANGFVLGGLLTCYAAVQFVCAPLWGRLSDRVGRRPVLLATLVGTAFSLLWLGLADSLIGLFLARLLSGAFAANISVATAYVADVTPVEERTRYMGFIGASFGVGFLIGPALGGLLAPELTDAGPRFTLLGPVFERWLSPFGHGLPMLGAAALALVNFGFAWFVLDEPARKHEPEAATPFRELVARSSVARILLVFFLFSVAVTQLETLFAFWMLDRFGYDARQVAAFLVAMALVMGTLQGGGVGPLARRFGESALLRAGAVLMVAGFATLPVAPTPGVLLGPLLLLAVGRALVHPALLSLLSTGVHAADQGAAMGAFQSSSALARIFGPLLAGLLYDFGQPLPFWLATALMGCATALAFQGMRHSATASSGQTPA